MSKHTPGPWAVGPVFDNEGASEIIIERQTNFGNLVIAVALPGLHQQEANARLIAASPDLLQAMQLVANHIPEIIAAGILTAEETDFIRSAIAKAKGE